MQITVTEQPFDPWQLLQDYQNSLTITGKFGATSVFIGTMRDFNEGDPVQQMELEHYPGMTEKELQKLFNEATRQWQVLDGLIVHRVGKVWPGDPIVLLAVWASHRGDAFDATRYLMEALKSRAPFWKKELLSSNEQRWVDKNTDGYQP